jgi:hypothetical protein
MSKLPVSIIILLAAGLQLAAQQSSIPSAEGLKFRSPGTFPEGKKVKHQATERSASPGTGQGNEPAVKDTRADKGGRKRKK